MKHQAASPLAARISTVCALALSAVCFGCGGAGGNFVEAESEAQFQTMVLESKRPVMVEFYSNGCLGCVSANPKLTAISEAYADRAGFVKVSRSVTEVRQQYEVGYYPTVIVFPWPVKVAPGISLDVADVPMGPTRPATPGICSGLPTKSSP